MASLFGHAISVVGYKKLYPNNQFGNKVLLLGIVAAVIPDIDVLSLNFGIVPYDGFGFLGHRGLIHSVLFAVVWAILLTLIFHKTDAFQQKKNRHTPPCSRRFYSPRPAKTTN